MLTRKQTATFLAGLLLAQSLMFGCSTEHDGEVASLINNDVRFGIAKNIGENGETFVSYVLCPGLRNESEIDLDIVAESGECINPYTKDGKPLEINLLNGNGKKINEKKALKLLEEQIKIAKGKGKRSMNVAITTTAGVIIGSAVVIALFGKRFKLRRLLKPFGEKVELDTIAPVFGKISNSVNLEKWQFSESTIRHVTSTSSRVGVWDFLFIPWKGNTKTITLTTEQIVPIAMAGGILGGTIGALAGTKPRERDYLTGLEGMDSGVPVYKRDIGNFVQQHAKHMGFEVTEEAFKFLRKNKETLKPFGASNWKVKVKKKPRT